MTEEIANLLSKAEFLDDAIFMTAALLFGFCMILLLKRKK